jgi:hypothetical protein
MDLRLERIHVLFAFVYGPEVERIELWRIGVFSGWRLEPLCPSGLVIR